MYEKEKSFKLIDLITDKTRSGVLNWVFEDGRGVEYDCADCTLGEIRISVISFTKEHSIEVGVYAERKGAWTGMGNTKKELDLEDVIFFTDVSESTSELSVKLQELVDAIYSRRKYMSSANREISADDWMDAKLCSIISILEN